MDQTVKILTIVAVVLGVANTAAIVYVLSVLRNHHDRIIEYVSQLYGNDRAFVEAFNKLADRKRTGSE